VRAVLPPTGLVVVVGVLAVVGVEWFPAHTPAAAELRRDPIEDDPAARPALEAADREADEVVRHAPRGGKIHLYWDAKKQLLKEKHGIEWRSPAEMNPGWFFD
jgi:hypothetical protein